MKRKFTFLIAAAVMLLTMMATTGTMWGETVKYTITSRNTLTTTGTAPTGSSATIVETYGTSCQMTKGNSQTLTLTNYYGYSISNITLSMKSNQSSGAGKLSYSTDGGTTFTYIVGSSNAGVSFNQAAWNGSWSTSYVDISKDVTIIPESGKNIIIKIEATANSLYCRSYQLTYTSGTTCATPTFTPAAGAVLSGSTVAISTTTDGATIYYTMGANPDDPTTSSDVYSEPIEITEATTIKAMAVKDGYNNSSIASASYTIATPLTTMAQIFADATANTSAHQVFITFDNWVITGNNGNNPTTAFLSDGTNGCRIYNNGGVGFAKGDILSGTASCNLSLYYGMAQLNLTSAASGLTIQTGGEVTPVVTTIDALTGIKAGSVVTLQGLTYNGSILTDGENSITPYNYMYSASLENDHVYNVTGVFEYGYNSVKRINPRDENDIEEVIITTPTISASNVDIACTATGGEIAYTINNPVDGGSLSATTESDWLILNSNFDSPIAFTCSSNTATEERTATVALTYTYNAKASVTKNVTVTQAAYEAPNVTWDLSTDQTATATTTEMTWTSNYVTMAVAKGSASTNTNNYYPGTSGQNYTSTRFYKNSILTITPVAGYDLSSIEFTATTEGYATTLKNSTWTNATASVSGTIVTVTPTNGTTAISATIGGTCGFTSVKVYYTESSDPAVATTVTIDATGITNTDVYTSTEAGSLSATVHAGETLIDGASVTWESSNSDAATIDENGVVTLVAAGTTTITASYAGVANTYKPSSATYELTVINSNAPGTENNPYTVADAMAAIDAQGTINEAYVTGIVSQVDSYNSSYHSITYWISDDGETTTQLEVYSGKGLNGANFSSVADVQVGATVVVKGKLKLYNQTYEFDYNNELVSYTAPQVTVEAPTFSPAAGGYAETQTVAITCATEGAQIYYTNDGSDPTNESFLYDEEIDIEETTTIKAIAYVGENASTVSTAAYYILSNENTYTVTQALEFETYPQNNIFVEGIVSTAPTSLLDGGLLTYYISVDGTETNRLQVYKGKNLGNTEFTAQDNIQVGDRVTIFGNVKTYNEIKEFDQGNYLVTWERLETVATPTFTPEEGEYAEAQSVTIACATEGAAIYYTLDGTEPTNASTLYEEEISVVSTTTIKAIGVKAGLANSEIATATYTINIPILTASITVDPALVEATADGGEGTLTVTYTNITEINADVYFCNENGDAATYDWIEAEIDDNNNVYYVIGANEGEARTAYFKVYALDDNAEDVYSNLVTINQAAYIAPSQEVVDILDNSFTGITGTTYTEWTNTGTSDAVYVGFSAGQNSTIQLRTKNSNEGIITTTSGGKVTKVEVTWNDNTSSGRKLDIYGKNTAYSEVSDLYNNEKQGTKLGTIEYDNNEPLLISGDYEFIGIRSNDGALYLDEIQITWSTTPAGPSITVTPAEITDVSAAGDIPEHTVILANLNISSTDDFLFAYCDLEGNILGNTDPKPNWIELAEAEYTATGENVYSMVYTVAANEETTPRTGYFKIGIEQATETVYSNIVTVTQLGYVTPVATITVVPNEVLDVPAAGDVYVHTVTLDNMTVESTDDFTLAFCDENGEVLDEQAPKPDWIEIGDVEFAVTSEENVYSLTYPVAENTETTPRTGYFKIGVTQTSETVYSNLVTVTQEAAAAPTFTVSFTLDGGTFVPNEDFTDEIVEIEAGTYTLPSATKSGFTFVGWNDGATTYASGAEYTVSGNVTFTAQWTVITTATINFNNTATGTAINEASVSGNDSMGNTWTITTEGTTYFYAGYSYCQVGSSSNPATSITFTTTLAQTTTITAIEAKFGGFSGTAGTITMKVGDETVGTGSLDATNDVTVTNTKTESGTVLTITVTNIQKGIKCYYISYTISNAPIINATVDPLAYNATSGSIIYEIDNYVAGEMAATTEADWISDFTYEQVDEIGAVGFTTTPNELYESRSATVTLTYTYDDSKATVTKDVTVTQAAAPIPTYIVSFIVGEGGTFVPNDDFDDEMVEVEAGTYTLPSATKEGYTFDGWNDGEQTYAAGASYEVSDDVEFTATYTALPTYTVSFWVNGDIDNDLTVTGSSITLPTASTLTPEGFEIYGWALENSTEAVADPYEPTADVTLYALLQLENAPAPSENYVKVTEELTDWSGEYLIVYEYGNLAFDGSLETLDGANNTITVTITNNTIVATATTDDSNFTIAALSEGGYSIQSASGYYIGKTNDGNGLDSSTETVYVNTISYDTENECVNIISSGGAYLRYNSNSGQERFRYFKSSTYTGQQAIQLYKKTSEPTTPTIVNVAYVSGTSSMPENIPESTCYVVEDGAVLTFTGTNEGTAANLVVQEGGQLIHESDVEATVQKSVSGYTNKSGDGWYLISSPVDNLPTSSVATGTYDLFAYDEATAYWWVDHAIPGQPANHTFTTLERGKGYLYANAANVNLNYAGTMKATNANITVDLSFVCDEYPDLKGFNLVGNPFTRNITATDMVIGGNNVTSYYDFNADRTEFVTYQTNERPIQPGQGFFIQATASEQKLVFNPTTPPTKDASDFKYISISAGDENFTDKAYIQFGYGNTLRKMTFGENTMVYVMNNDDDYAAARVEELAGTMPVHFVPIEDGFYTITVETKNIENLNYMHLIDNIKNTEIDLLVEPSYTFKASESDNADRFHLVFDFNNYTGVNENYTNDNFAHQIGDEIFVSGEGTLQVFDVLGRFVTGYNVNGDKRISTAEFNTGVYIFRMVGTEVKTQKIIVR